MQFVWFPIPVITILHLIPYFLPFLTPRERPPTDGLGFGGEVGFFCGALVGLGLGQVYHFLSEIRLEAFAHVVSFA